MANPFASKSMDELLFNEWNPNAGVTVAQMDAVFGEDPFGLQRDLYEDLMLF